MNDLLISTIISALTGIGGFIYGVQKDKKDLVSKSLTNLEYQITVYEKIIDSLREEILTLVKKVDEQEKIIIELQQKIDTIKTRTKKTE